jgi:hypothetical protein
VAGPVSSIPMAHKECPRQGEEAADSPEQLRLGNVAEAPRRGMAGRRLWHPNGR